MSDYALSVELPRFEEGLRAGTVARSLHVDHEGSLWIFTEDGSKVCVPVEIGRLFAKHVNQMTRRR